MVARARNGRICTVRASCNFQVFDQALRRAGLAVAAAVPLFPLT